MVRYLALVICFLNFNLLRAQSLDVDLLLKKPISLRLKIVSLSECVKALSDATGAKIYVAPNIKDRKVTLIFKDRSAAEAMTMLADALFGEWSPQSGGYVFRLSSETLGEERRMLATEQTVLKEQLANAVQKMVSIADKPVGVLTDERDALIASLNNLGGNTDADSQKRLREMRSEMQTKYAWIPCAFALKGATGAVDALAGGETLWASSKPGDALPLPMGAIATSANNGRTRDPDGNLIPEPPAPTTAVLAMRCNFLSGEFETRLMSMGNNTGVTYSRGMLPLLDSSEAGANLVNQPLRKHLTQWTQGQDQDVLSKALAKGAKAPESPGYYARGFTLADHLAFLADTAGIPVVADAFRTPFSGESRLDGTTVGDYVQQLKSQVAPMNCNGYYRTEKGWLLCKHAGYWRQFEAEVPEQSFVPIESKAKAGMQLTLDDYAKFAASLTPSQAEAFPYRFTLTRFPRTPFASAMPILRLWGALDGKERQQAYTTGLAYNSMSADEQQLYRQAGNELLWLQSVTQEFIPILIHGVDRSGGMQLFMRDARNGAMPTALFNLESFGFGPPPDFGPRKFEDILSGLTVFTLGPDLRRGANYAVTISKIAK